MSRRTSSHRHRLRSVHDRIVHTTDVERRGCRLTGGNRDRGRYRRFTCVAAGQRYRQGIRGICATADRGRRAATVLTEVRCQDHQRQRWPFVVNVHDGDVIGVDVVITTTAGGANNDGETNVAVIIDIVHTRNSDNLRNVPVHLVEGQLSLIRDTLGCITCVDWNRDVTGWLQIQDNTEGCFSSGF